jgi:hypothetical protein
LHQVVALEQQQHRQVSQQEFQFQELQAINKPPFSVRRVSKLEAARTHMAQEVSCS